MKALDIEPDGILGHSVGELGCAYVDGCFTAEETIMAAYARGRASADTKLTDGLMAAVGLGYQHIKDRLPHDIDVACHNSSESCTISGPSKSIMEFVEVLKSEKVFAKMVNVSSISFHSRYIQPAAPALRKYLTKVCCVFFVDIYPKTSVLSCRRVSIETVLKRVFRSYRIQNRDRRGGSVPPYRNRNGIRIWLVTVR